MAYKYTMPAMYVLVGDRALCTSDAAFVLQPADFWGIICKGAMTKLSVDKDGNTAIVAELGPGDMFGSEMLLGPDAVRAFTVEAKTPVRYLELTREKLREMQEDNSLAVNLDALLETMKLGTSIDVLKEMEMFRGVSRRNMETFMNMLHFRGLSEGEYIIKEGGFGNSLYIVQRGELEARSGA